MVTYSIDVNGILKVTVENPRTGNAEQITVNSNRVNLEEDLKNALSQRAF